MQKLGPIYISVDLSNNRAHIFDINLSINNASKRQRLMLPSWTPGSYLMREFAQHIVTIKAYEGEQEINILKINKNTFELNNISSNIKVNYQVYGFDSSIRAAFIDDTQAFFNGSSLFLCPMGREDSDFVLTIKKAVGPDFSSWEVATAMPRRDTDDMGFGSYVAKSYLELIDYPFQVSAMKRLVFSAANTPHEMVLVGDVRPFNSERLISDLIKICECQLKIFGGKAPFEKYLFIARFEEGGHGGLEHRNSSMLLSSPYSLPDSAMGEADNLYRTFLSLCSHEYFHAWNVKRLLPQNFVPYDLSKECYTTMLWLFEGITSYYDDLVLCKSQAISRESYLEVLAKSYTRLLKNKGRLVQSVAQASFDAWIKFYRPNENSQNATVSYYLKGAFIGLIIDLMIRSQSQSQISLDHVMNTAFKHYGQGGGISEEEFFILLKEISGVDIQEIKEKFIYGTSELPLLEYLRKFGVEVSVLPDEHSLDERTRVRAYWGMKWRMDDHQRAMISYVDREGPAIKAGLCPGDEVLAINNIRLDSHNWSELLCSFQPGALVNLCVARKKHLKIYEIELGQPPLTACKFTLKRDPSSSERALRLAWLGE